MASIDNNITDSPFNALAVTTGGVVSGLIPSNPGYGQAFEQNNGFQAVHLEARFELILKPSATIYSDTARIAILIDTQSDGALPATTAILQAPITNQYNKPLRMENIDRFIPIFDRMFHLNATGWNSTLATTFDQRFVFEICEDLDMGRTVFGNNGTGNQPFDNNLIMLAISAQGNITLTGTTRVHWHYI